MFVDHSTLVWKQIKCIDASHILPNKHIYIYVNIYMYLCVCIYIYVHIHYHLFFLTWDVWKRLVYDRIIHNHTYTLKNAHPYPVSTFRCKGFQTLLFPNLKIKQSGYSYLVLRHCSIFFQSALSAWDHLSHSLPFHHWVSCLGLQHSRRQTDTLLDSQKNPGTY